MQVQKKWQKLIVLAETFSTYVSPMFLRDSCTHAQARMHGHIHASTYTFHGSKS